MNQSNFKKMLIKILLKKPKRERKLRLMLKKI